MWAVRHHRTYLYGHNYVVYTDHEAIKSPLNMLQRSGDKQARWGMALQNMDLTIVGQSGVNAGIYPLLIPLKIRAPPAK